MKYSEILKEHFINPKNNRVPDEYNLYAKGYNPDDGDTVEVFIKTEKERIEDMGYLVKGCPRAIAAASYTSELIKGMFIKDVLGISEEIIGKGLQITDPRFKCIPLTLKTIKKALLDISHNRS